MGFFSDSKDRLLAGFALPMLNSSWLKPYGQATDLKVNSTDKTLEITVQLRGESTPVRVEVQEYELTEDRGKTFVVIKQITISREWMTELARNFLIGKQLEVPAEVAGTLARAL